MKSAKKKLENMHMNYQKTIDTRLAKLHLEDCYDVDHPLRESVEIALINDADDSADADKTEKRTKRGNLQMVRHRMRFFCPTSDTLLKLQLNCVMYLMLLQRSPER